MNPLLPPVKLDSAAIVRASRSSFVPAFRLMTPERRGDLETFYAFCRVADDLADRGNYPPGLRYEALGAWRAAFRDADFAGLPRNLRELIERRALDRQLFLELLDGTATDLASAARATRAKAVKTPSVSKRCPTAIRKTARSSRSPPAALV